MKQSLQQSAHFLLIIIRGIPMRRWIVLANVGSVAIVVGALTLLLATVRGFNETVAAAGANDVVLITRAGAPSESQSSITPEQLRLISDAMQRNSGSGPTLSPELYLLIDGRRSVDGAKVTLALRGVGSEGAGLRPRLKIVEGRIPEAGRPEVMIGRAIADHFDGFLVGAKLPLVGNSSAVVVGIFESAGQLHESELWTSTEYLATLFRTPPSFQVVRMRLPDRVTVSTIAGWLASDPRLKLEVRTERQFFERQARRTVGLIRYVGMPLAVVMALGALAAGLNTMAASAAARRDQSVLLRALGFLPTAVIVASILESVILGAISGALGTGVAYALFDGLRVATLSASVAQIVFGIDFGVSIVFLGTMFGGVLGLVAGVPSAILSMRAPLTAGQAAT